MVKNEDIEKELSKQMNKIMVDKEQQREMDYMYKVLGAFSS